MKTLKIALPLALILSLALAGTALAQRHPVLTQPPQEDAAVLLEVPDMPRLEYTTIIGRTSGHSQGVIIRQSRIEDGKIIIPPSGLVYTNRGPRSYHLRGDILNILGTPYYLAYYDSHAQVVSDLDMKMGDGMMILNDKYFTLSNLMADGGGHYKPAAVFAYYRAAGWGGNILTANKVETSMDFTDYQPSGLATGIYDLSEDFRFDTFNYTTDFPTNYSIVLKTGALTSDVVHVDEFILQGPKVVYITPTPPITGYYSAGDKVEVPGYTIEVLSLNEAAGLVGIRITDAAGKVTEGEIGPMPDVDLDTLLNRELEQHKMIIFDPDHKVQVEMSPHRRTGLWRDGQVALNILTDIVQMRAGSDWIKDDAWIYRPDT